jgi:hypothetical protein
MVHPRGATKGTLLRPALYIFCCVACVPDYYYGATYYFYTSAKVQEKRGCDGATSTSVDCWALPPPASGAGSPALHVVSQTAALMMRRARHVPATSPQ